MSITDEGLKAQIVIAASIIAGKGASENEVTDEVTRIAGRIGPGSAMELAFEQAAKRAANTVKTTGFPATILHVDKELTSERAVLFLKTKPSQHHANGKEIMRTERTDTPEGKAMAILAQSLTGHDVFLTMSLETMPSGHKVRVARGIEDKGVNAEFNPQNPEYQPDMDSTETLQKMRPKLASQQAQTQVA